QFGKTIIDHQAVAFRLADMSSRIDAAWLQVLNAARMIDAGEAVDRQRVTAAAAMAKLNASETAMFCTCAAVQTLGGWGYSRGHAAFGRRGAGSAHGGGGDGAEQPVGRWMRDGEREEVEEGPSDIMRLLISRNLG